MFHPSPPPPPPPRPGFAPGRDVLLSVVRRFSYLVHALVRPAPGGAGAGALGAGKPNRRPGRPNTSSSSDLRPPGAAGQASLHTLVNRHSTAPCTQGGRKPDEVQGWYQVDSRPWEGRGRPAWGGGRGREGPVGSIASRTAPSPNTQAKSPAPCPREPAQHLYKEVVNRSRYQVEYEVEAWEAGGALPRATRAWRPPRRRCARSPRRPGRRSRRAPRWRPWPAARGPPGPARPPPTSRRALGGRTGVGTTVRVIRMASMRGTTTATTSVRGRSRPWRLPAVRPTTPHSRRRKRPPGGSPGRRASGARGYHGTTAPLASAVPLAGHLDCVEVSISAPRATPREGARGGARERSAGVPPHRWRAPWRRPPPLAHLQ